MAEKRLSVQSDSSVYSRSSDSPKLVLGPDVSSPLPGRHKPPDINSLDHQIAMVHGSTMALETTRGRLQHSKSNHGLSAQEIRDEKLRQYNQQRNENNFYRSCRDNFRELAATAMRISQYLENEANSYDRTKISEAMEILNTALEASRDREARAEEQWKQEWEFVPNPAPPVPWI